MAMIKLLGIITKVKSQIIIWNNQTNLQAEIMEINRAAVIYLVNNKTWKGSEKIGSTTIHNEIYAIQTTVAKIIK